MVGVIAEGGLCCLLSRVAEAHVGEVVRVDVGADRLAQAARGSQQSRDADVLDFLGLEGVAALALGIAGRKFKAVAPWLAWVSLVLGGLTIFLGVSPAQYMAGMTGPLWLTIAAIGLLKDN